jgi:mRNA-degrading endonuclease toxin of MazEF toxin-antitoxin module
VTAYNRGAVVRGPDVFGGHSYRPWIVVSDETHPFGDEEGLFVAVTTTPRRVAIPLRDSDFRRGGLPRESYANPWSVTTLQHTDIAEAEGYLTAETTERIAGAAAGYLGVDTTRSE